MRIKLHDSLGYLVHVANVEHPLKKLYIWGNMAFEKTGNRRYTEVTFGIITDTQAKGNLV